MQFSEEEEDSGAEVLEAADSVFELLDIAVEAFDHGVGDSLVEVADDPQPMLLEPLGHLDDRIEPTANRLGVPTIEEASGLLLAGALPKLAKEFLDPPSPRGFQNQNHQ